MTRICLLAIAIAFAVQAAEPDTFAVGPVTVVVPPPDGFENAWHLEAVRDRFPNSPGLSVVAVYLPAGDVNDFDPKHDITFYARVAIADAAKDAELPAELLPQFAQQFGKGATPDQRKRLAELEKQTGVVKQPIVLGVFDQTPQSLSGLMLEGIRDGKHSANVLTASSVLRLQKHMLNVFTYRRFTTMADRTTLEDFTKAWVRKIIAANPG